jgi:hypothetical protein
VKDQLEVGEQVQQVVIILQPTEVPEGLDPTVQLQDHRQHMLVAVVVEKFDLGHLVLVGSAAVGPEYTTPTETTDSTEEPI